MSAILRLGADNALPLQAPPGSEIRGCACSSVSRLWSRSADVLAFVGAVAENTDVANRELRQASRLTEDRLADAYRALK